MLYAETQRHSQPISRDLAAGLIAEVVDRFAGEDLAGLPELDEDLANATDAALARTP